ncbi:MAG TPA: hypothetical protein VEQ66_13540 [Propionibacteriaceae bacterium]|nr:hypothetical protein [Propionibacteriaceae bacterium]
MPTVIPARVATVLCDADGTLLPSEEPASAVSVPVSSWSELEQLLGGAADPPAVAP